MTSWQRCVDDLLQVQPKLALLCALNEDKVEKLKGYVIELVKWNQRFNFVSRKDIHRLAQRHILDSAAVYHMLQPGDVLDIGTGAGLPGMVLAILDYGNQHERQYVLADRNARKVRFLNHVSDELGLSYVKATQMDVGRAPNDHKFSNVVSRAVAPVEQLWQWSERFLEAQESVPSSQTQHSKILGRAVLHVATMHASPSELDQLVAFCANLPEHLQWRLSAFNLNTAHFEAVEDLDQLSGAQDILAQLPDPTEQEIVSQHAEGQLILEICASDNQFNEL